MAAKRCSAITLSFLYQALVRLFRLLRLVLSDSEELTIEVVMLSHEVVVPHRQISRPTLRPSERAASARLGGRGCRTQGPGLSEAGTRTRSLCTGATRRSQPGRAQRCAA